MIQIQDNQIIRDGLFIGFIEGDIAYMQSKPAPRLVPQIREAAGNAKLKFEVEPLAVASNKTCASQAPKTSQTITGSNAETAAEMPVPDKSNETSPGEAPTIKDSLTVEQPQEIGVTVEVESYKDTLAQAPQEDVELVKPSRIYDLTGFPDYASDPRMFAKCFINNYGPDAFTEWQKTNA